MIGKTLLHYEVGEKIGAGGMGVVYRGRDTKLGRDVAIKVLPEAIGQDEGRLSRFKREAKVLASLNHPNIAQVYGMEECDGVHFLVMELVPGETLAESLKRGALSQEDALQIARQVAAALEVAHEKGIVHRDLKPANIMVTPDGQVNVLDFGLAKVFADETGDVVDPSSSPTLSAPATRAGVILGTAAYMKPRAGAGPGGRQAKRHLLVWLGALRDAGRSLGFCGSDGLRHPGRDSPDGAGLEAAAGHGGTGDTQAFASVFGERPEGPSTRYR